MSWRTPWEPRPSGNLSFQWLLLFSHVTSSEGGTSWKEVCPAASAVTLTSGLIIIIMFVVLPGLWWPLWPFLTSSSFEKSPGEWRSLSVRPDCWPQQRTCIQITGCDFMFIFFPNKSSSSNSCHMIVLVLWTEQKSDRKLCRKSWRARSESSSAQTQTQRRGSESERTKVATGASSHDVTD